MKTIFELMQAYANFTASNVDMAARAAVESGLTGAKDVYLAWGKSLGISAKDLEAEWKAAQPEKAKSGPRGFADMYYDWLAEAARTEQEACDYIMSSESKNVQSHLTHYLNIWALAESVRSGKKVSRTITAAAKPKAEKKEQKQEQKAEEKDAWTYNDADPFADVRSAWENLKRETAKAKPRKSRIHPDKVAKFGDEKLTEAYTKAFQVYSK